METKLITLHSLFAESDFPDFFKSRAEVELTQNDGTKLACEIQLYYDFLSKAKFIGVFIPFHRFDAIGDNAGAAYVVSEYWAHHSSDILSLKSSPAGGFISGELTKAEDLAFTGRIYIYHENQLTLEQIVALRALYRSQKLEAQFRGVDYLYVKREGPQ
jgi:hypothetical protein